MDTPRREISLGVIPEKVREGRHICHIYNDDVKRWRTIARLLENGFAGHKKVLYLVDTLSPAEFLAHMKEEGIYLDGTEEDFSLLEAPRAYTPDGKFIPERRLKRISEFYRNALEEGYTSALEVGEMTWALGDFIGPKTDLMVYEAKLNEVLEAHPYTACCQYDARKFEGAVIFDVLRVHPQAIIGGKLINNPFFLKPEEFLKELESRSQFV